MRMTVTGGAGFIGSHLVDRLLAAGHEVVVLDDFSTGKHANLPEGHERLRVIEGDVADPEAAAAATEASDAVYHLAAVASVQASIDDPVATHRSNLLGTLTVLEAARRAGPAEHGAAGVRRFVYASSAAVYGDAQDLPVAEGAPKDPLSPYAADKLAGEHYLAHYHRRGELRGVAFRFFNVYGPRQDPSSPYSGVISIFLERAAAGLPITVFGDGEQTRDFVFVGDVVDQLVSALDYPAEAELQVYNVGTEHATSLLELIGTVQKLLGPLQVGHELARAGDIRHSLADASKLRSVAKALGVRPPGTRLEEGLATIVAAAGPDAGAAHPRTSLRHA